MNWNKVLTITTGLTILAGISLHQGQVHYRPGEVDTLLVGTALNQTARVEVRDERQVQVSETEGCNGDHGAGPDASPGEGGCRGTASSR